MLFLFQEERKKRNMKNKYHVRQHFIGVVFLVLLSLILCGCKFRESKNKIQFINDKEIEYNNTFKVSSLVNRVDEFVKSDFTYSEDDTTITLPNGKTVMVNYKNKNIKLDTIEFAFRYEDKIYTKKVLIKDTTPPKIECRTSYDVQKGNEYFILENIIKCTDNYSKEHTIEIYFNGTYNINKKGKYVVEVIAYDEKKNKSTKGITINVVENEVKEDYMKDNSSPSKNSQSSNNTNSNTNKGNSSKANTSKDNSSFLPKSKDFTINTYDNFDICLQKCSMYIEDCIKKGYRGNAKAEPIEENGTTIGYRAVFY